MSGISEKEARKALLFQPRERITEEKLRKNFNKLARITHPDRGGNRKDYEIIKECRDILLKKYLTIEDSTEDIIQKGKLRMKQFMEESQALKDAGKIRERKFNMFMHERTINNLNKKTKIETNNIDDMIPEENKRLMKKINEEDMIEAYKRMLLEKKEHRDIDEKRLTKKNLVSIDPFDTTDYSSVVYVEENGKKYAVTTGKRNNENYIDFDKDAEMDKSKKLGEQILKYL